MSPELITFIVLQAVKAIASLNGGALTPEEEAKVREMTLRDWEAAKALMDRAEAIRKGGQE